jgi:hypothetical protein
VYHHAVRQAPCGLWYLFDFMCGKRLAVMIRATLETLASSGELSLNPEVLQKLLTVSPAAIDRLLSKDRRSLRLRSRSRTKPGTLTERELELLAQLYQRARLLENFFYPSMTPMSETRVGSKLRKHFDAPRSPYQGLLDSPHVWQQTKGCLRLQKAGLNPVQPKREIARIQQSL